jgi:hypothetical protein
LEKIKRKKRFCKKKKFFFLRKKINLFSIGLKRFRRKNTTFRSTFLKLKNHNFMVFLKKVLDAKNDTFHSKNKFFFKKKTHHHPRSAKSMQ